MLHIRERCELDIEVYGTPTHMDQYLLLNSYHPLELKLEVIRTLCLLLPPQPDVAKSKDKNHRHLMSSLKVCGYPDRALAKTFTKSSNNIRPLNRMERQNTKSYSNTVFN